MDINEFVPQQVYVINDGEKDFRSLRCMDDRYEFHHTPLAQYGVPGGGMGILADVVAGFEAVLKKHGQKKLTDDQKVLLYDAAQYVIGTPSFHTGKSNADFSSPVEGCGYLAETLEGIAVLEHEPLISVDTAAFLKSKAAKLIADGYQPVHFPYDHDASFVLFIDTDDIGVIPTAQDGTRAYVVHEGVRMKLLQEITENAYLSLSAGEVLPITLEEVIEKVISIAEKRFGDVAKKLGADKIPHYSLVHQDGQIVALLR